MISKQALETIAQILSQLSPRVGEEDYMQKAKLLRTALEEVLFALKDYASENGCTPPPSNS